MMDKKNLIKMLAFGALAVYLWRLHRKQGTSFLGGDPAPGSGIRFRLDHEKVTNAVVPFLNLGPEHEGVARFAIKEFLNGFTATRQLRK
jgi:hypothetical protein